MGLFTSREPRRLTEEPLHVAPEFVGRPLATPTRRAVAFAVDYVVLFVPAILVALAAAVLSLRMADPGAYGGFKTLILGHPTAEESRAAWGAVGPILVHLESPGLPAAALEAGEANDREKLAEALQGYDLMVAMAIGEREEVKPPPHTVLLQVEKLIPRPFRALALFGVAALYFTLLHASRRGQTLGKRLLGIRVVQLAGEPLSLFESFERAAAYLEIPATLGLSLVSLWRDPNRRLPHDRVVHTAVLRVERQAPPQPKEAPIAEPESEEKEPQAG